MGNGDDQKAADRRLLGCLFFFLAALCFIGLLWLYFSGFIHAFLVPDGETLDWVVVMAVLVGSLSFFAAGVFFTPTQVANGELSRQFCKAGQTTTEAGC
jgi:RsiW-degrading membrane proteinase PrsW (M82 family)